MSEFKTNKAVFVGVILEKGGERKVKEYLDELQFLAETAGAIGDKMFTQRLDRPDKATYIGPGKLEEIKEYCLDNEIEYVIFDDELTGMQQRNIEKIIACSDVIDRTSLILEIFAQRAKTSYAKMQVELAHYNYMLPRLAGMWTHLERQRGGMGTRGGMGETQIEIDRRIVKQRISKLKEDLKKVDRQMATQRGNRGSLVRLALVGYTNVGKSTLMNLLAKSDVFAENKLFATLDTTVRKVVIENVPFLLSDTVGFIRKLPTQLVEAFKSTLDEVREADVLVHVVDISHPDTWWISPTPILRSRWRLWKKLSRISALQTSPATLFSTRWTPTPMSPMTNSPWSQNSPQTAPWKSSSIAGLQRKRLPVYSYRPRRR